MDDSEDAMAKEAEEEVLREMQGDQTTDEPKSGVPVTQFCTATVWYVPDGGCLPSSSCLTAIRYFASVDGALEGSAHLAEGLRRLPKDP